MTSGRTFTFRAILLAILPLTTWAESTLLSGYARDSVSPVQLSRTAEDRLKIQYSMPPESLFHSPGIDFRIEGEVLRIAIRRCNIKETCNVMAKAVIPPAEAWRPEVTIHYGGQKVIMMYADGEEQVYP
ncbi:hypothetical protein ALQ04_00949 [Pseudomonas cichorii]|uniref:Uncharacterized protein n=1 Tax=Pseudomonas cichorii TaxID=36746 RepID=A0A3M4LHB1_PSECI|nr:hypothetical protein [Pseudomonas cichorii]RMQ40883.1 hypothetical protein ALQ04_00949 [Pseudomonas cichorii]